MDAPRSWQVGCALTFEVEEPAELALQVAVAGVPGRAVDDRLEATLDGRSLGGVLELGGGHGGRIHRLRAGRGLLRVTYEATATATPAPPDVGEPEDEAVILERLLALRPSRYCPSDALAGFAAGELGRRPPDADLARSVVAWVSGRIAYAPGSTGPLETAVDTLLAGRGVCRDFAHLGLGLARSVGIPARLVAAYAPGLSPMDFHAVVEAHVEGAWHVFDPTCLAPRPALLRIATGRDAADTALADVLSGTATLTGIEVRAIVDGRLPDDDGVMLVRVP